MPPRPSSDAKAPSIKSFGSTYRRGYGIGHLCVNLLVVPTAIILGNLPSPPTEMVVQSEFSDPSVEQTVVTSESVRVLTGRGGCVAVSGLYGSPSTFSRRPIIGLAVSSSGTEKNVVVGMRNGAKLNRRRNAPEARRMLPLPKSGVGRVGTKEVIVCTDETVDICGGGPGRGEGGGRRGVRGTGLKGTIGFPSQMCRCVSLSALNVWANGRVAEGARWA